MDWATFTLEGSLFLISIEEQSLCFLSVNIGLETDVVYDSKGVALKEDYQIYSEHA